MDATAIIAFRIKLPVMNVLITAITMLLEWPRRSDKFLTKDRKIPEVLLYWNLARNYFKHSWITCCHVGRIGGILICYSPYTHTHFKVSLLTSMFFPLFSVFLNASVEIPLKCKCICPFQFEFTQQCLFLKVGKRKTRQVVPPTKIQCQVLWNHGNLNNFVLKGEYIGATIT